MTAARASAPFPHVQPVFGRGWKTSLSVLATGRELVSLAGRD